jgi:hypothetical protein
MKQVLSFILFISVFLPCDGQGLRGLDKSPLDIAYFPDHFAHDRKQGEKALVKVVYSRPFRNGREVFGELVPYGKVWRTGANENTEITFYQDATVAGKKVKKGTYSLFTIPGEKTWTIILNSDLDYWGAYSYNEKNDVLRVDVSPEKAEREVENFTIQFLGSDRKSASMVLAWDDIQVNIPVAFLKKKASGIRWLRFETCTITS